MNRNLLIKLGAIAALILLLMVPILMIDGMIEERQSLRDGVLEDIARSSSYSRKIVGPLLVVPYVESWQVAQRNERGEQIGLEPKSELRWQLQFPQQLDVNGSLVPQERYRGTSRCRSTNCRPSWAATLRHSSPINCRAA